jgi:hypothetical protein
VGFFHPQTMPPVDPLGDALVRWFIRAVLLAYGTALLLMCRLRSPDDWATRTNLGRAARGCWIAAYLLYVCHVALAFHYYHHWSHAHAVAHTEAVSGWGEGIFVSHAFTLLWGLDVLTWLFWPVRYAQRSPWIDRCLHAFMLFIIFNGAVVFATGAVRWLSLGMFVGLAVWWWMTRRKHPVT